MKIKIIRNWTLALFFIGGLLLYFVAPLAIIQIDIPLLPKFEGKQDFPENSTAIHYINNHDSTLLYAHYIQTTKNNVIGTIILIHGIRSNSNYYVPNIHQFTKRGYNVVCPDLRAHGKSKGKYCTYGYYEKEDLSALVDYLELHYPKDNLGIWGQSLGGAISIQALAQDKRLKYGVIESTFSSLNDITHDYCERMVGFDIPFITNFLLYRAGQIANFPTGEILPKNSCKKIIQPIIFVHGNEDEHINIKYNRENYQNVLHSNKLFLEIDNATHLNVWQSKNYFYKIFNKLNVLHND